MQHLLEIIIKTEFKNNDTKWQKTKATITAKTASSKGFK
jgi:hypothetical protein